MSEAGPDGFQKFESAKQFSSWLRLVANNKISGGRVLSNKAPKDSNQLKIAHHNAANAVGNLNESHLSHFFKRVDFKKGRAAAISATARKLGVIIYTVVTKRTAYKSPNNYMFPDQKRKLKLVAQIKKFIAKSDIKPPFRVGT